MKQLVVTAIKDGTVIDHIPSEVVFKVVEVMGLQNIKQAVMVACNLESPKHELKGIVKVAGLELDEELLGKIAVIAPRATVNIIKNYKVDKKVKLEIPEILVNVIRCPNPNCITNHETITTKFKLMKQNPLRVQCHYCERSSDEDEFDVL